MKDMNMSDFICKNCGGRLGRLKFRFNDHGKTIIECISCGLLALNPMPSENDLNLVYNESYFKNEHLTGKQLNEIYGYVDYISERINKQRGYKRICQKINAYLFSENLPPRLLDFGCGLGHFLDSAYDFGLHVEGVEFNNYAIDYIKKRYAYKIWSFDEFNKLNDQYDVIVLFDVIEHLREPFELLTQLKKLLSNHGLMVISTMDSNSLISRLMGKRLEDFRRIREHLYFFSKKNLTSILARLGFQILEVSSLGHTFEIDHLCDRIKSVLPIASIPIDIVLKIFPFLGKLNVHVNPFTKFIVYARK